MKKTLLWGILSIVILGGIIWLGAYSKNTKEETANFSEEGVSVKNLPGMEDGRIYLLYEKPGQPALTVPLKFDEKSMCGDEKQKIICMALSVSDFGLTNGRRIKVSGDLINGELHVLDLEMKPLIQ